MRVVASIGVLNPWESMVLYMQVALRSVRTGLSQAVPNWQYVVPTQYLFLSNRRKRLWYHIIEALEFLKSWAEKSFIYGGPNSDVNCM